MNGGVSHLVPTSCRSQVTIPYAARHPCHSCRREFTKDFLNKENDEYTVCFFCETEHKVSVKLEALDSKLQFLEGVLGLDGASVGEGEFKVVEKVERLEDRVGEVEKKVDTLDSFQPVRKGGKAVAVDVSYNGVVTRNRFQVLE